MDDGQQVGRMDGTDEGCREGFSVGYREGLKEVGMTDGPSVEKLD